MVKNTITLICFGLLVSCGVPKDQFNQLQNKHAQTLEDLKRANAKISELEKTKMQVTSLKDKVAYLVKGNDDKLTQIGNYAVLSKKASENMNKTLEQLSKKDAYIQRLRAVNTKMDSLNLVIAANLKSVLQNGINDQDINIIVEKTVVYISISDKLLFKSGSYQVSKNAGKILKKVADVINAQPHLEVMVEGHTDDKQILNGSALKDNWDLSVKRSTAIVRLLQNKFAVSPERLIASGRSEYQPLVPNTDKVSRATNRRTKIIILPKLDQFFELLDMK